MTDIAVTGRYIVYLYIVAQYDVYNITHSASVPHRDTFFVSHKIHSFCSVEIVTITYGEDDLISPGILSFDTALYVLLFNGIRYRTSRAAYTRTADGRNIIMRYVRVSHRVHDHDNNIIYIVLIGRELVMAYTINAKVKLLYLFGRLRFIYTVVVR